MTTRRTRREKVYTGDNLWQWRDVPLAMDAALEEDDEDDQDERDHEAAVRAALDTYRKHREANDDRRLQRGQDRRRGRDSEDPTPGISHRPEHQPTTGSRSEQALIAGDSARRARLHTGAARDAFPGLTRIRVM